MHVNHHAYVTTPLGSRCWVCRSVNTAEFLASARSHDVVFDGLHFRIPALDVVELVLRREHFDELTQGQAQELIELLHPNDRAVFLRRYVKSAGPTTMLHLTLMSYPLFERMMQ